RKDFPLVQRWASGQAVAAEAALDLLEYRAGEPKADDDPRIWPEFSEYDCFGCHHKLTSSSPEKPNWRQDPKRPPTGRRRDALAWGSWYFAVPRIVSPEHAGLDEVG